MRHSRSAQFAAAQADAAGIPVAARWNSVSSDPNDPLAVAVRARTLSLAFRPPVADRIAELERRCQGRSVLDIGAVAHDSLRMDSPTWLHGRLAAAAASCLAVDILPDGVEAMRARGFDAVVHDLSNGVGPLAARGPFEVIVAGEIIEHVPDQGMLFRTAQELLAEDGELVITTPNPFAPKRTAAGRRGIVWENTDHILLAFPTGIAELAQRHGLRLAEAFTVVDPTPSRQPRKVAARALRTVRGRGWQPTGFATTGELHAVRVPTGRAVRAPGRDWFVGETFVYVVRRPTNAGG